MRQGLVTSAADFNSIRFDEPTNHQSASDQRGFQQKQATPRNTCPSTWRQRNEIALPVLLVGAPLEHEQSLFGRNDVPSPERVVVENALCSNGFLIYRGSR